MSSYTLKNLRDVEEIGAARGMAEVAEVRFPREALGAQATGLAFHVLKPGKRLPFGHRHAEAEEIYVVVGGSGRMKIEDDIIDLASLDAVRVAPEAMRSIEGGPEGLEMLVFGPRHEGDGELDREFWVD